MVFLAFELLLGRNFQEGITFEPFLLPED